MKIVNYPVKDILSEDRFRKDMGDIPALWENIKDIGLIQPIVLSKSGKLVAGGRRLAAYVHGNQELIPAVVSSDYNDLTKALQAESAENEFRKEFTISEKVEMAKRIESVLAEAAKDRAKAKKEKKNGKHKSADPADPGSAEPGPANDGSAQPEANGHVEESRDDEPQGDKSRNIAAKAVNMAGETYRKASEVVEAAKKAPTKYGFLVEEMDATGKVNGAHKKLKQMQAPKPKKVPGADGKEDEVVDAEGTVIQQKFLQDRFGSETVDAIIDSIESSLTNLRSLTNPLKEVSNWNVWMRLTRNKGEETPGVTELISGAVKAAKEAKEQIEGTRPHVVCKKCGGSKCKDCRNTGFWPKWRAEEEEGRPG